MEDRPGQTRPTPTASGQPADTPAPRGLHGWARFLPYLRDQRWWFLALCLLSPLEVLRHLAAPQLVRRFIDVALAGGPTAQLVDYALWFVALAAAGLVLGVAASYVAAEVAWRATNQLREDLVEHSLRQGPDFFLRHPIGELVDRIDGDVGRLAGLLSGLALELATQVLLIVGILSAMFVLDWRYGLLFTPFSLLMLLVLSRLAGRAMPLLTARRQAGAELLGFLEESMTGREDIRANGATAHVVHGLWTRILRHYGVARRAIRVAVAWPAIVQVLAAVNFSAALALGLWLHSERGASVGTVYAGLSYAVLLRMPLISVTTRFQDVEDTAVSVRRLGALLAERNPVRDGGSRLPPGAKSLAFDRVTFHYGDQPALADVSFSVPAGRRVALIGRTGSGKSTVLRLLFRQYDPGRGVVSIDGHDLRELDVAALRERITLVTQDACVMRATLRESMTFFDPGVPDDRLVRAVEDVGLGAWYARLRNGLDTRLDDDGSGLSVGEEQLLTLARALLTEPDIVLLDEPSARLDPHNERLLHRSIDRFTEGRTTIIIAHRAETLRMVDEVLVLENGRVVGFGPPARLAREGNVGLERLLRAGEG